MFVKMAKFRMPMFRKRQNVEFQSLENAKIKIAKFGKGKI